MEMPKRIRIGDLLVQSKLITQGQLTIANEEQQKTGRKLIRILVDLKFVDEEVLLTAISKQLKIPFVDLKFYQHDKKVISKLPEAQARRFKAIVLSEEADGMVVAMADPTDLFAADEIRRVLNRPILLAIVRESELINLMDTAYRRTDEISSLAIELEGQLKQGSDFNLGDFDDEAELDAPVVKLLQSLFEDALRMKASDIHIEPDEKVLRIRQRIDGVLQEQIVKEKRIASALVMRLKIMSGLDISEKRLPQDGRFSFKSTAGSVDVRLSTLPTMWGESVVMRLLDQTQGVRNLKELGMPERIRDRFDILIRKPNGMILVTGPTGSGKTTTLYSALNELNSSEVKIITAEDPVEYRLPRINQVQVNAKIEFTFAKILRSALRQDPDVVLIGEMRDQETAEIGLRAAMTGHLVMSTLHTNDSISTVLRLVDMGADPYLVAAALRGILAQRLVRRICVHCSKDYSPTEAEHTWIKNIARFKYGEFEGAQYKTGSGCPKCNNTGYSGRIGLYELLEMNDELVIALRSGNPNAFEGAVREMADFETLGLCGLHYAKEGITSLAEVFKVAAESDVEVKKLDHAV